MDTTTEHGGAEEVRAACIAYNQVMASQAVDQKDQPAAMRTALKAALASRTPALGAAGVAGEKMREALKSADEQIDQLMIDKAWLTHCLAINVDPVVRRCVIGVVGLDTANAETLVEHLTATIHAAIRPQGLKDSLAAAISDAGVGE